MIRPARHFAIEYGVAIASLAAAVLIRWLPYPVLGDTLPLTTLFAAIGISVWIGGYRPAVLVAVLGYEACHALFIAPDGQSDLIDSRRAVGLLLFLATAAIIISFGETLRRARQRYREGHAAARGQAESMRITLASIGDGVIATDRQGRITTMNAIAEALTGWSSTEIAGLPLTSVFRIANESTRQEVENPAIRALTEGAIVGLTTPCSSPRRGPNFRSKTAQPPSAPRTARSSDACWCSATSANATVPRPRTVWLSSGSPQPSKA